MLIDQTHVRWVAGSAIAAAVGGVLYAAYALTAVNAPAGGSWGGLFFAFAGTGLIVFECLLSLRKRYPASPIGRVSTWLKGHLWLGLVSFVLILFHTGFQWGEGLAAVLMTLFTVILVSGVLGVALQNFLPRRMMELVPRETVYEQIPDVIQQLRFEADERVEFVTADLGVEREPEEEVVMAGGRKYYFDKVQRKSAGEKVAAVDQQRKEQPQIEVDDPATHSLRVHSLHEIRPFLYPEPEPFSGKLFATTESVAGYFRHLRTILPVAAHEVLEDVEAICEERRQLAVQRSMHHWLHGWLYVHVPLSFAFLVLILVHAVASLRY